MVRSGTASQHAEALFRIARRYGLATWPKLLFHVESLNEAPAPPSQ